MARRTWRANFARGALPFALLAALSEEPTHGYRLMQILTERGLGAFKPGTVYPALLRLEESGDVTTSWDTTAPGPARKEYRLTTQGLSTLQDARAAWQEITSSLERMGRK